MPLLRITGLALLLCFGLSALQGCYFLAGAATGAAAVEAAEKRRTTSDGAGAPTTGAAAHLQTWRALPIRLSKLCR